LEPDQVGPTLAGVDVVRKREDRLRVPVVVLETHLDTRMVALTVKIHRDLMDQVLVLVQEFNEGLHAAIEVEDVAFQREHAIIGNGNLNPFGEKRELPKPVGKDIEAE